MAQPPQQPVPRTVATAAALAQARQAVSGATEPGDRVLIRDHLEAFKYYPASARRRGIEGSVEVRFALANGGRAADIELVRGSGHAILDRAALQTVHRAEPFPLQRGSYRFRLVFRRS